jgi:hypothetical protein
MEPNYERKGTWQRKRGKWGVDGCGIVGRGEEVDLKNARGQCGA